jgi:hypothetical protein
MKLPTHEEVSFVPVPWLHSASQGSKSGLWAHGGMAGPLPSRVLLCGEMEDSSCTLCCWTFRSKIPNYDKPDEPWGHWEEIL